MTYISNSFVRVNVGYQLVSFARYPKPFAK